MDKTTRTTLDRQGSCDGSVASSAGSFREKDFQLPDLEITNGDDLETTQQVRRIRGCRKKLISSMSREKRLLRELDHLSRAPDGAFHTRKGVFDRPQKLKATRGERQALAELDVLHHVLERKPGELKDDFEVVEEIMRGTYDGDDADKFIGPPALDHPKLNSVQEKVEDLRQESLEKWCKLHGTEVNQKYTNKEKRMLRKWFEALDYDGSGEVNVEELQDPMLSSGILKTREQVVRVLANVDKNNTMGIDFEEFLVALGTNKLADQDKLKKLQQMSADPHFNIDTLIAIERRKKLIKSILKRCELRQNEVDQLYKKYDKAKLTRREKELFHIEREALEEEHSKSIYLHLKYITALNGVIEEKKKFNMQQMRAKELSFEEKINQLSSQDMYRTMSQIRFGGDGSVNRKDMMNKIEEAVAVKGFQPVRSRGTAIALQLRFQNGGQGAGFLGGGGLNAKNSMLSNESSQLTGFNSSTYSKTVAPFRAALTSDLPLHGVTAAATAVGYSMADSRKLDKRAATIVPPSVRSHNDLADNRYKIYAPTVSRL